MLRSLIIIAKTKEMVITNKRGTANTALLTINGDQLELVSRYEYLGAILNNKMTFKSNTTNTIKKRANNSTF